VDVVAVVHLGQVVERAGELRERQRVLAAVVLDLDVALFDVDVRRAVLAHRAQLDQVGVRGEFVHRPQQLERADHVALLRDDAVVDVLHRPRRARLLAVVDDRLRPELAHHIGDERVLGDVADVLLDGLARHLFPGVDPLVERGDRGQRVGARLLVPAAPGEVVDHRDLVPLAGKSHRCRPTQVAVTAENQNSHPPCSLVV
jgi:hypothetical protein